MKDNDTIINVNDIHIFLLYFQAIGYFIEDVLELHYLDTTTDEKLNAYKNGDNKIADFWFEIEFELFQLLYRFPFEKCQDALMLIIDLILQMRTEKFIFKKMKKERGAHWKTRAKVRKKLPKKVRQLVKESHPVHIPDEIQDSTNYVIEQEYTGRLPLGYESDWYCYTRKGFTEIIFELRADAKLPKNEKIILDSIAKIYSKL